MGNFGTASPARSKISEKPDAKKSLSAITLGLTPQRREYRKGAIPDFTAIVTNMAKRPICFCSYMLRYRLMLAMVVTDEGGYEYGLYPFRPARFEALRPQDLRILAPGESFRELLALSRAEGWGFVRTGSQPPFLTEKYATKGFSNGTHTFKTLLFDRVTLYTGRDGMYDRTLSSLALPDEIPGARRGSYADVFRGDVRGQASVRFV